MMSLCMEKIRRNGLLRASARHNNATSRPALVMLFFLSLAMSCFAQPAPSPTPMYIISAPTPETGDTRQTNSTLYPSQEISVNDIQMILSGVTTLSSTSRNEWAQVTVDFIADQVGKSLKEYTAGEYYNVSFAMESISQGLSFDGRLTFVFTVTMSIQSAVKIPEDQAYNYILDAFDTDQEKFVYITDLKNTDDAAFQDAVDVQVTISGYQGPTETPPTTEAPTEPPTQSPTMAVLTSTPTESPTAQPTASATTEAPVEPPTVEPTETPPEPTPTPTVADGGGETASPSTTTTTTTTTTTASPPISSPPTSASPTVATTFPLVRLEANGLEMILVGIEPLNRVAQSIWSDETAAFISQTVDNVVRVSIDVTDQDPPFVKLRSARHLQQVKEQTVTFDAVVTVQSNQEDTNVNSYILSAFDTPAKKEAYIDFLQAAEEDTFAFDDLRDISVVQSAESITAPQGKDNLPATIGIAVGLVAVGAAVVALLTYLFVTRHKNTKETRAESPLSTAVCTHAENLYADEIEVGSRAEVSTLGDPIPPGMRYGDVLEGGTMFTAATDTLSADYDFQKAFHRSQLSIMDSTVGDSEAESSANFFPKDSMSLDEEYLHKHRFEVDAPAGLLGLVIDTSEEGLPTIRAIKETSCLAGQVEVGDVLLSVDDEDVSPMMASTVSRLIASKQRNPVRKFVFTRLDEGDA